MKGNKPEYFPVLEDVLQAAQIISEISEITPLTDSIRLSKEFNCQIRLKREDLQRVRSYKIRGAFNKLVP